MTNKLVVIIKSLRVPKIKKILLYEMKFLVPNYSCLSRPLTRGLPPPDPRSLCPLSSTEFVGTPPPPNKIPGYATDLNHTGTGICQRAPEYLINSLLVSSHPILTKLRSQFRNWTSKPSRNWLQLLSFRSRENCHYLYT
jgi:hypothetical protein